MRGKSLSSLLLPSHKPSPLPPFYAKLADSPSSYVVTAMQYSSHLIPFNVPIASLSFVRNASVPASASQ